MLRRKRCRALQIFLSPLLVLGTMILAVPLAAFAQTVRESVSLETEEDHPCRYHQCMCKDAEFCRLHCCCFGKDKSAGSAVEFKWVRCSGQSPSDSLNPLSPVDLHTAPRRILAHLIPVLEPIAGCHLRKAHSLRSLPDKIPIHYS